jgi:uncharacterized protein (DUF1499 family)
MMKAILKRGLVLLVALLALLGSLALIESQLGQPMGLFAGSRPTDLGFKEGSFKPCPWKPNCVSSTADKGDAKHYIAPLALAGTPEESWAKLKTIVNGSPRVTVVTDTPGYIHAEFKTAGMGFVDDVEFALHGGAIQVRSAARLGIRDFDVNRKRIEGIRAQLK